jgi:toxin FitB
MVSLPKRSNSINDRSPASLSGGRERGDTNVSLMRSSADPVVTRWLDAQPVESVWIRSITLFETRFGLELPPAGRWRQVLDMRDTQIAGIVLARRGTLATRNARHFADLKISIVDPWPHK